MPGVLVYNWRLEMGRGASGGNYTGKGVFNLKEMQFKRGGTLCTETSLESKLGYSSPT